MLSRVQVFATPWNVACQAPLSTGFSRQEYWRGLPCPLQGIFLTQGSNPGLLHWRQTLYPLSHQGKPLIKKNHCLNAFFLRAFLLPANTDKWTYVRAQERKEFNKVKPRSLLPRCSLIFQLKNGTVILPDFMVNFHHLWS